MTQGYGPDHGQQGQWGQSGPEPQAPQWGQPQQQDPQAPQWGQPQQQAPQAPPQWGQPSPMASPSPPQWGQASPASAPGGYPGAAGYSGMGTGPQFEPGDGVDWKRVKLIGLILLVGTVVLLLIRLGINLAIGIGAEDMAASDAGGEIGAAGIGSSLATLLLYILNFLVGVIMCGLGIAAAVMGRARARVGGIVVAAAFPLSVVLFWVFTFLAGIIAGALGAIDESSTTGFYYVTAGTGIVHALVMVAIIALGSFFVHSTASKKLSA